MDPTSREPTKKFLFDINDFGEEALRKKREAARRPTFSQEEMEASRQTGFEQGRAAGIKETLGSQEAQIRDVLQQVVFAADRLEQGETERLATFINLSALMAAQAIARLCPALLDHFAADQVMHFIRDVLGRQIKGQAIVIHVAPEHAAYISARLDETLAGMHRKLACTVEPDAALDGLQCRFEWTGGGAQWDPAATLDDLLQTLRSHLPEDLRAQAAAGVDETAQTPHNDANVKPEA